MPGILKSSGKPCPICDCKITRAPEDQEYIWCPNCAVVRTKYSYDSAQYGKEYAINYLEYAKSPINTPLNLFRLGLVSRWLKKDSKILDVGCCIGEFIRFAEKHYYCAGFEPNLVAAKEALKRTHSLILPILNGILRFDCVTMFDVIEHIQEPVSLLKQIHNILRPDGILAITTPNIAAVSYKDQFKVDDALRAWKHFKPKEHLYLYGFVSLKMLLHKNGFDTIHTGTEESDIRPGNPEYDLLTLVARRI